MEVRSVPRMSNRYPPRACLSGISRRWSAKDHAQREQGRELGPAEIVTPPHARPDVPLPRTMLHTWLRTQYPSSVCPPQPRGAGHRALSLPHSLLPPP
eukprot:366552-Chlamydomonas_euryale.AAC.4